MKSLLTVFLINLLFLIPATINGQIRNRRELKAGVGLEIGIPGGNLTSGHLIGIGGSFLAAFSISDLTDLTFYGGYISFIGKNSDVSINGPQTVRTKQSPYSVIPLLIGSKFHISMPWYLQPQVGISYFTGGNSAFSYSLGLGVSIKKHIDISARFQQIEKTNSKIGFIAIRFAYNF